MSGWIFACGKTGQQTLAEVVAAGATSLALSGASGIFTAGQLLFISEANGSETQWLGKVASATATALSFTRPLQISKNTGALVWRATGWLAAPEEPARPASRSLRTGVLTQRSVGGQFYAVSVSEPLQTLKLSWRGMTPLALQALLDWLATATAWGLEPFTLVSPTGRLTSVRLAGDPIEQEEAPGERASLSLALVAVEEGAYR